MLSSQPTTSRITKCRLGTSARCAAKGLALVFVVCCLSSLPASAQSADPAPTAIRGQDSRDSTPAWLRPFQWQDQPSQDKDASYALASENSDERPPAQNQVQPGWLKAFRWTNAPADENLEANQPDVKANYAKANRLVAAVEKEAENGKPRQGSHPFSWTNVAPLENNSRRSASAAEEFRLEKSKAAKPFQWSNSFADAQPQQSLTPPEQTSFSEAVYHALSWQQDPAGSAQKSPQDGSPPADATDAELVEWEKQHYPWIRPFYWSDNDTPIIAESPEFGPQDLSTTAGGPGNLLNRPFQWSNNPQTARNNPLRDQTDSRTIAFLQDGEEIPRPLSNTRVPQLAFPKSGDTTGKEAGESESEFDEEEKGALAGAETLGREPEDNSLQFLRADTVLLKPGEFQYDYGLTYTKFDLTLPVLVSTSPTTVTVEDASFRAREMLIPFELRYGLARRVQLFLNVPLGWANTEFTFTGLEEFENDGGIGDLTFGGTFLLRQGNHQESDAILTLSTSAPTGEDPFSPVGLSPAAPALGSGVWSLASNVLFVRNYDPVVMFYGYGTRHHFEREINGVLYRAGGEYLYQMGVGFAVNESVTFSTRFNGAYITETRIDGARIPGTIREPMTLSLAMTVSKCKRLIEPFVDFGLTDDAADARIGIIWTR